MLISSIEPFVRFIGKVTLGNTKPKICADSRLFYILDGAGKVTVNNEIYTFAPNTVLFWQAGTRYSFSSEKTISLISVNFDFDYSRSSLASTLKLIDSNDYSFTINPIAFENCEMLSHPIICQSNIALRQLLEKMITEDSSALPFFKEQSSAYLKLCIIELVRINSATPKNNAAVETVIEYIRSHYYEDLDNYTLAALVNYHPHYLNKVFSQVNDITLHQYIVNYRLFIAKTLLLSSEKSVAEISADVGFGDPSSFSYSFKKAFGTTPTGYRKNEKKNIIGE